MSRQVFYPCVLTAAAATAAGIPACCAPTITAGPAKSDLKVQSVAFEPIGEGCNVVRVNVSNPTDQDKLFAVHIQSKTRFGWGRPYLSTLKAGKTDVLRYAFRIWGPVGREAWIRLRFYAPRSVESYDFDQYFEQQRFEATDLNLRPTRKPKELPESDARVGQVKQAFAAVQELLRQERYQDVWDQRFTQDYRDAGFHEFEAFAKAMAGTSPYSAFDWERDALLGMRPVSASFGGETVVLSVTDGKETWTVDFVRSDGRWRVNWIAGCEPPFMRLPDGENWEQALLLSMEKLSTEHFDIHYFKGSTAERELASLARTREQGYAAAAQLLGSTSSTRIRLILFEDMRTKVRNTGHQGMGLATGSTIVEVYNEKDHLDPYHETTHVLMSPFGNPPAIFTEGVAVYMSEELGAPALRNLGGADYAVYARVRDIKQKGEWIPLTELLTYTEIGSEESRPAISYPEAGAFVKYFIEKFGKDAFLAAYGKLDSSDDPKVRRTNQEEMEGICGMSLQALEDDWTRVFSSGSK